MHENSDRSALRVHLLVVMVGLSGSIALAAGPTQGTPEGRAVAYLAREVPRWSRENHCFSCHNNGDAARALFAATTGPDPPPAGALADTIDWLARPERWDAHAVDPAFGDARLARLQFAAALASAVESGRITDRAALARAAAMVAGDQDPDGSWPIDAAGTIGSPATYGRALATAMAVQTLRAADPARLAGPIARAEGWLRGLAPVNVPGASAVLLGLSDESRADRARRREAFDLLLRAQGDDGGWGPYLRSPPEPFDTALALIALARWPGRRESEPFLRRGRASLIAAQNQDGSWPETTRPAGGESYAQRLSTSGWATLALLGTGRVR